MLSTSPTILAEPPRSGLDRKVLANDLANGVELREMLQILWRRRAVLAILLGLGILVGALSVVFATNRYSATAVIEVNREGGSSLGLTDLSGAAGSLANVEGLNVDLLTQQAVILSDNTALRVIDQLKLDSIAPYALPAGPGTRGQSGQDSRQSTKRELSPERRERALQVFRSSLRVSLIKGTRLLTVTFTDTDPHRAAVIANAIVDAYVDESTRARFQASSKTSTWLAGQLTDLKRRVEESQARVDVFRKKAGLPEAIGAATGGKQSEASSSALTNNAALVRLLELNRALTGAEVTRIAREAVYRMTQTGDPEAVLAAGSGLLAESAGPDVPLAQGSTDVVLLQQLRQQRVRVKLEQATASTKYGARNPAMIQLQTEEASLEAQIRAELDRMHTRAQSDLQLAALDESGIRRQIAEQEQIVNAVAEKADQLLILEEEARSSRAIYQDLYTKLEEAGVTSGIKASNITLVDPARAPAHPSYPRKRMALALGCMAGLLSGLLAAFAWDYLDESIATPEEAERISLLPAIGAIPYFDRERHHARARGDGHQDALESRAWLVQRPRSHVAEAYRALRTALLLSRADEAPRTILWMSGSPEEGKSTTCFNAAAAFALQGDRVLYLDADLRRPKGHTFFSCANDVGLSDCLTRDVGFAAALRTHPEIATLFLLPAGPETKNPSELLGAKRFAGLVRELREHFDYVFIDSPPVLMVTDAQLIAPLADGCVLIVRSRKTLKRLLGRSLALMHTTHVSMVGIVVNAFKSGNAVYSAYGYYGKESGYYAETQS